MKRYIILIDGSNFYFKLKDIGLHNLQNFDFSRFAAMLIGQNSKLVSATYYVGKIKTEGTDKSKMLFIKQQKLLAKLKSHDFNYSLGQLMKYDGIYHEKGVDVKIAVDMLAATYENLCDTICLVSSDTDLIPAVHKAREKGREVVYVGLSQIKVLLSSMF